jgi:hypothetical protein
MLVVLNGLPGLGRPSVDTGPNVRQWVNLAATSRDSLRAVPGLATRRGAPELRVYGLLPVCKDRRSRRNQNRVQSYIRPVAHGNGHHGASAGPRANRLVATFDGQRSSRPGSVPVDRLPHDVDRSLSLEVSPGLRYCVTAAVDVKSTSWCHTAQRMRASLFANATVAVL